MKKHSSKPVEKQEMAKKKPDDLDLAALRGNLHMEVVTFAREHGLTLAEAMGYVWQQMYALVGELKGKLTGFSFNFEFHEPPAASEPASGASAPARTKVAAHAASAPKPEPKVDP
jgi:hypothetical protein